MPLTSSLCKHLARNPHDWVVFLDLSSKVDLKALEKFLGAHDPNVDRYFGCGLTDEQPTIIHHFRGFDSNSKLAYPNFAAGLAFSNSLFKKFAAIPGEKKSANIFTIDAKHEIAVMIKDILGSDLTEVPETFCISPQEHCAITYEAPDYSKLCNEEVVNLGDVFTGVKTYSKFHRTRIVAVKRTWANRLRHVEYFSDIEDQFVPTKSLGIDNTERGHCAKTLAILKYYVKNLKSFPKNKWLVVADDDTLLSVPRLLRLLRCYDHSTAIIIGERYGFGFSADGTGGYDYPTGGAGMIFSREAAKLLVRDCTCPKMDSPDDMIIGSCARSLNIPIIHSPAFHQARPVDYAKDYIGQLPPISFHKFEDIDPYDIYINLLHEEMPTDLSKHTEL